MNKIKVNFEINLPPYEFCVYKNKNCKFLSTNLIDYIDGVDFEGVCNLFNVKLKDEGCKPRKCRNCKRQIYHNFENNWKQLKNGNIVNNTFYGYYLIDKNYTLYFLNKKSKIKFKIKCNNLAECKLAAIQNHSIKFWFYE